MGKQLQLSVPKPCHENWNGMTHVEKGRFCGSCQKQVMDFTDMSDSQLIAFFKKESPGAVCGRFMPDQLNRAMMIPKKRIPWVRYFFQFTIPLFLTSLKTNAQMGKMVATQVETPVKEERLRTAQARAEDKLLSDSTKARNISGQILDRKGEPLPYAIIRIKGKQWSTNTDSNGNFTISGRLLKKNTTLVIYLLGYEMQEKKLTKADINSEEPLMIRLHLRELIMGDVDF